MVVKGGVAWGKVVGLGVGEVGDAKPDAKNKSALSAGQDHQEAANREAADQSCKAFDSVLQLLYQPAPTCVWSVCADGASKPLSRCIVRSSSSSRTQ